MRKNETDNMQQLYHKTCGFCEEFCGNAWCITLGENMSKEGKDYMEFVKENWIGDPVGNDALGHAIVGLCGEAGELANLYKKGRFYPQKEVPREAFMDEGFR